MQANSADHQALDNSSLILGVSSPYIEDANASSDAEEAGYSEPTHFRGYYASCMEMFADAATVVAYLDIHREWFTRCAHPMSTAPLGENGYELTVGRFGSFGYEVEPKIGLNLLPHDQLGVYRIETIPIPGYEPPGYEVDFRAALQLVEVDFDADLYQFPPHSANLTLPTKMTRVEWDLNLDVAIQFPRFIQALPKSLIHSTGDRLLNQIVRQVSRCLTHKVQEDFHSSCQVPFMRQRKKFPWNRLQVKNPGDSEQD